MTVRRSLVEPAPQGDRPGEEETAGIVASLLEAGNALDGLWLSAVRAGSDDSIRFAEAAQAVYQALAALDPTAESMGICTPLS